MMLNTLSIYKKQLKSIQYLSVICSCNLTCGLCVPARNLIPRREEGQAVLLLQPEMGEAGRTHGPGVIGPS